MRNRVERQSGQRVRQKTRGRVVRYGKCGQIDELLLELFYVERRAGTRVYFDFFAIAPLDAVRVALTEAIGSSFGIVTCASGGMSLIEGRAAVSIRARVDFSASVGVVCISFVQVIQIEHLAY